MNHLRLAVIGSHSILRTMVDFLSIFIVIKTKHWFSMHIYTHICIYRKVNFHCPWCPMSIRLNPLSPPIVLTDLYLVRAQYCSVSQSGTLTHSYNTTHSLLHYSIDKSHIVGNSTPYAIVHALQFKVLVLSLEVENGARLFLLLLFNWITFITYLMYRYFKALTQKCRITGQPILFLYIHCTIPILSFSFSMLLIAAVQQKKKPFVRVLQKKGKPNWKKQIVSYGNFMMTFAFQTVHLVFFFLANARMRSICINLNPCHAKTN